MASHRKTVEQFIATCDLENALYMALSAELPELVERCLDEGANPGASFMGATPLCLACEDATDNEDFLECIEAIFKRSNLPDETWREAAWDAEANGARRAAGFIGAMLDERMLARIPSKD